MPQQRTPAATTRPATADRSAIEYLGTIVSAWLVPGAGHWLLGWRVRGALLGGAVLALFWVGQALAVPPPNPPNPRTPMAVCRRVSPIFFACQVGNGLSALVSNVLWGEPRYPDRATAPVDRHLPRAARARGAPHERERSPQLTSSLLHVIDPRTWREPPEDPAAKEPEAVPTETNVQETAP